MPEIVFLPKNIKVDAEPNMKILVAAIRNKVDIRFGCAACQCGTCGIALLLDAAQEEVNPMEEDEKKLLHRMGLSTQGDIRLACRARILSGTVTVDLGFQQTYSPDQIEEF